MATNERFHSDLAIPPGEYLAEVVEELGVSQAELARRMGRPPQAINEIVLGKRGVTADTALRLARYFGMSPQFWLGLQMDYELDVAEDATEERIKKEIQPLSATG